MQPEFEDRIAYFFSAIDECLSEPCRNGGKCSDENNEFICDCEGTGFYGIQCEHGKLLGTMSFTKC